MGTREQLKIDGRNVAVSNLDKVLYPTGHFTKAQVIDYYLRVSPFLLPHLKDRPVTLKRYPDGVRGEFFYEKDAPGYTPKWVKTFPVPRRAGGSDIHYVLINDLSTLVWAANIATLEFHPFLHRVPNLQQPTYVVFDLDPGQGVDVLASVEVAYLLKDVLAKLHLDSFPKVSGSKGIQLYVPLNTPVEYAVTQPFARTVAELLAKQHPDQIVSEMAKAERIGKVFIDWSQNADFKTTIAAYSLRAKRSKPFVSLPVTWEELSEARQNGQANRLYFEPESALKRLQQVGDLFAPVLSLKQSLPDVVTNSVQFPKRAPAAESKSLRAYAKKRDFSSTSEPRPNIPAASGQGARRRFVVQKHAATHLHYDFRLEMHQVLKSWAVPKGIPYDLGEKRLAMATEDHPIGYLDFEGTIPKGQYGGGTVMVWDIGTYELMEGNYYKGNLQLYLEGKKLQGEWLLTKDRSTKNKNWWLRKSGSPMKPPDAAEENRSALTGRALEQIAAENDAQWQSNRTPIPDLDLDSLPPNVSTQAAEIDRTIRQEVMFAKLCTGFAVVALLIACVGLYGTMSYSVARQLGEIGIRMALGAQRGALVWMVLRRVLLLAAVGLAISVPAALSASRLVKSFLFETQPNDPGTLALAGVVLLSAAILAGYAPARRASRIDPVAALRQE